MKRPSKTHKALRLSLLPLALTLLFAAASCSGDDDGDAYPSVLTELVEATTNSQKNITKIRTDSGRTYSVSKAIAASAADSTYRCLCVFLPDDETGDATVYQIANVFSAMPWPASRYAERPHDPVQLISAWNSGRYLNFQIAILTTDEGSHAYGFCEDSASVTADGRRTLHLSLLHQRPAGDAESYTEKHYFSLPAYRLQDRADSIALTVLTYDGPAVLGYRY